MFAAVPFLLFPLLKVFLFLYTSKHVNILVLFFFSEYRTAHCIACMYSTIQYNMFIINTLRKFMCMPGLHVNVFKGTVA
jgi:hypothetical protein